MKNFEYVYNILYYFFYRGLIKIGKPIVRYNPFVILIYLYYKIPSVKQKCIKKGIDDPYRNHIEIRIKKFLVNPEFGYATMYGAGTAMCVVFFIYMGFYHIFRQIFLPDPSFYPSTKTVAVILGLTSFATDVILSQVGDKGEKYIKEFNKNKGWWRVKWSIVTALSPFLAIGFALLTR